MAVFSGQKRKFDGSSDSHPPFKKNHTAKSQRHNSTITVTDGHATDSSRPRKKRKFKQKPNLPEMPKEPETRPSKLSEEQKQLCQTRAKLPIFPHEAEIRRKLRHDRHVLLLVGETGSGKSTQVPQFLLAEDWCKKGIAITQPRRVGAITLARRVAEEMFTTLGNQSPLSKVGYSVRFDHNVSPATRLKYLTEGMLLQEMLRDPWLTQYSCVIVDEVHERSVNCDLILGYLRRIVSSKEDIKTKRGGEPLRVVVMSATASISELFYFFRDGFLEKPSPGITTTNVENFGDIPKLTNGKKSNGVSKKQRQDAKEPTPEYLPEGSSLDNGGRVAPGQTGLYISDLIAVEKVRGRQYDVDTIYLARPSNDHLDDALHTIKKINKTEPLPGDILVFLTGQEAVESLAALVDDAALKLDAALPKLMPLPLFAALPRPAQQAIFLPAPRHTRKVILATNIAETSVTIPGVRFVVDSGLAKVKEYRPALHLDSLLVKPISQSAALQRHGRAGREAPGKCYRLYTEAQFLALPAANTPEIQRCDLADALLGMKARGIADPLAFPLLSPPPPDALRRALARLARLGALDARGTITPAGQQMARLPLAPPFARVITAAAARDRSHGGAGPPAEKSLVLAAIDAIAALTAEKILLPPTSSTSTSTKRHNDTTNANADNASDDDDDDGNDDAFALQRTLHRREGDAATLAAVLRAYTAEPHGRSSWARARALSHRGLRAAADVRRQLRAQCAAAGLLGGAALGDAGAGAGAGSVDGEALARCFLAGFPGNVAVRGRDGAYRTVEGGHAVAVHPGSVLHGRRPPAVVFSELVFTQRAYARGVSAVQVEWYAEAAAAATATATAGMGDAKEEGEGE